MGFVVAGIDVITYGRFWVVEKHNCSRNFMFYSIYSFTINKYIWTNRSVLMKILRVLFPRSK